MNRLDRIIRDQRIEQVVRRIRPGSRVFDIGCHDGALFRRIGPALRDGVGVDPDLAGPLTGPNYRLVPGLFPKDAPFEAEAFDVVCALAVLEHVMGEEAQQEFARGVEALLKPGGIALFTVPSPRVDDLLHVLMRVRALDGMEAEAHHGFDVGGVIPLFQAAGLELSEHRRFQFGLNNLFEFRKPG